MIRPDCSQMLKSMSTFTAKDMWIWSTKCLSKCVKTHFRSDEITTLKLPMINWTGQMNHKIFESDFTGESEDHIWYITKNHTNEYTEESNLYYKILKIWVKVISSWFYPITPSYRINWRSRFIQLQINTRWFQWTIQKSSLPGHEMSYEPLIFIII